MVYGYRWGSEGRTKDKIQIVLMAGYPDQAEGLLQDLNRDFKAGLPEAIREQFAEEGISIYDVSVLYFEGWFETDLFNAWYHYKFTATFFSDTQLHGSPIASWVLALLKKVIWYVVLIIIAFIVIQAIKEWLTSITTETTTIETHQPDCTWTKETVTEPSALGLGVLLLGVLIIGGVGVTRRKREPKEEEVETIT